MTSKRNQPSKFDELRDRIWRKEGNEAPRDKHEEMVAVLDAAVDEMAQMIAGECGVSPNELYCAVVDILRQHTGLLREALAVVLLGAVADEIGYDRAVSLLQRTGKPRPSKASDEGAMMALLAFLAGSQGRATRLIVEANEAAVAKKLPREKRGPVPPGPSHGAVTQKFKRLKRRRRGRSGA